MTDEQFTRLKAAYRHIRIPEGYDMTVNQAMSSRKQKPSRSTIVARRTALALAALVCAFAVSVNALPAFAMSLQELPVLGPIAQVLTLARYRAVSQEQAYEVDVAVPVVQGLENAALQSSLNAKYLAEGRALYDAFMKEVGGLEPGELAHKALAAGYVVKVQTDDLLVVEHWVLEVGASGAESVTYDNIDLRNQVLITLPSLFRDDRYLSIISDNILAQMEAQTDLEAGIMYFPDQFTGLTPAQSFYINDSHQLVIVFDEYAVAPGSMGVVEFVIPTEVIADQLVGTQYIR